MHKKLRIKLLRFLYNAKDELSSLKVIFMIRLLKIFENVSIKSKSDNDTSVEGGRSLW